MYICKYIRAISAIFIQWYSLDAVRKRQTDKSYKNGGLAFVSITMPFKIFSEKYSKYSVIVLLCI